MAGVYGGSAYKLECPCWSCICPGNELNSMKIFANRDFNQISKDLPRWIQELQELGNKKKPREEAKAQSLSIQMVYFFYFFIYLLSKFLFIEKVLIYKKHLYSQ